MSIMAWLLAMIVAWNGLLAAGWRYNPSTNTWTAPPSQQIAQPVPERQPNLRPRHVEHEIN
ncbi:MAG: hypothetical protein MOB07_23220 [Acidobacteria bacterium]|nr:hypothetical protein [Acidobacteriota bacterium]